MDATGLKVMWESMILRGVAGILFGIAAVFWPGITLVTLVYIFSIYILVSGVIEIVDAVRAIVAHDSWIWKLLLGFVELGVGVYLVRHPGVSFATLILLIGLVLIARGVFEVVLALLDDFSATEKTLMIIGGVLAVIVGIAILMQPAAGGVAFVWILGLYALLTGPMWIALGIDAKNSISKPKKK
ncbi:MAG: DUF308 domain-containing protein [Candidatus Nomurabacteria bacterium]|nr:DUF308 domain-containing protein [Candidatus Saccharibacteria bacterium]USN95560.1 MAG: DUF308 domain-containing protein [Candidatus Nomurabacteria bacterium]